VRPHLPTAPSGSDAPVAPCCRRALAGTADCCPTCTRTLTALREELTALTRPSGVWSGGPVIPLADIRRVPADARRAVASAIVAALDDATRR